MAVEFCSPTDHETAHLDSGDCGITTYNITSITVPSDCDCLVVMASKYSSPDTTDFISGITWDSSALTRKIAATDGADGYVEIWYILNPTTGATPTLAITLNNEADESMPVTVAYLVGTSATQSGATDSETGLPSTHTLSATGDADDLALSVIYDDFSAALNVGTALSSVDASGCGFGHRALTAYDDAGTSFDVEYTGVDTSYGVSAMAIFEASASGGQSIAVNLITESDILFSPSVDAGDVSVGISLINESESLFSPSADPGSISIPVGLIGESELLFSPAADPGSISTPVGLITENELLFAVGSSQGQPVAIAMITENGSLFSPAPDPGAVNIPITIITENETLFVLAVGVQSKSATVTGITGGESLSGLSYCVFNGYDIGVSTLIQQGSAVESTDANGDLVIDLTGTSVNHDDPLIIIIDDFTTSPGPTNRAAVCHTTAVVA